MCRIDMDRYGVTKDAYSLIAKNFHSVISKPSGLISSIHMEGWKADNFFHDKAKSL